MTQETVGEGKILDSQSLETDALFAILSHERRRYALYCLQKYRNPMTLADLADEVARLEYDEQTIVGIPEEDIKRIYMDLYHKHIPKMNDANAVEYNQATDTVRLRYEFTALDLTQVI